MDEVGEDVFGYVSPIWPQVLLQTSGREVKDESEEPDHRPSLEGRVELVDVLLLVMKSG